MVGINSSSWAVLVTSALLTGCAEAPPEPDPAQRMRVVQLDAADHAAIFAPRFDTFCVALVRVREKEAQRPLPVDGIAVPSTQLAAFNGELEQVTVEVINIMGEDHWSREDRALMNRALRRATLEDLRSP